jgi:hypothetical protein
MKTKQQMNRPLTRRATISYLAATDGRVSRRTSPSRNGSTNKVCTHYQYYFKSTVSLSENDIGRIMRCKSERMDRKNGLGLNTKYLKFSTGAILRANTL